MSAEPIAVGHHLDHVGADELERATRSRGTPAAGRRRSSRPARACRCRARTPGRARRRRPSGRTGPSPTTSSACATTASIPRSRTSCMKIARDPALGLPARTPPRPASSRAGRSGRSGAGSTWPCSTSRYIGVPCETLDAEDLAAGVGVRVEMDETDRAVHARRRRARRARRSSGRRRARSGSRRRRRPRPRPPRSRRASRPRRPAAPAHRRSRRPAARRRRRPSPRGAGPGGQLAARIARGAEARPRPVGDEIVGRRADDRDVGALEARPRPGCTGAPAKVSSPA